MVSKYHTRAALRQPPALITRKWDLKFSNCVVSCCECNSFSLWPVVEPVLEGHEGHGASGVVKTERKTMLWLPTFIRYICHSVTTVKTLALGYGRHARGARKPPPRGWRWTFLPILSLPRQGASPILLKFLQIQCESLAGNIRFNRRKLLPRGLLLLGSRGHGRHDKVTTIGPRTILSIAREGRQAAGLHCAKSLLRACTMVLGWVLLPVLLVTCFSRSAPVGS